MSEHLGNTALIAMFGCLAALALARLAVGTLPGRGLAAKTISQSTLAKQEFPHER